MKNNYILIGSIVLILLLVSFIIYRYIKSQKREIEFRKAQQKAEEEIFDLLKEYQLKLSIAKELEQNRISKELSKNIYNSIIKITQILNLSRLIFLIYLYRWKNQDSVNINMI